MKKFTIAAAALCFTAAAFAQSPQETVAPPEVRAGS